MKTFTQLAIATQRLFLSLQTTLHDHTASAQLRKLEGPNYQHKLAAGRKSLFHSM